MCVNHGVSAAPAPATVAGIQLGTSDNDVTLSWSAATTNLYGDTLAADHYNVYRGTTPGFVPDYAGGSNRIAQSTTTNFTDTGALAGTESYFYHVTAVSADGTESLVPSSIAYKLRLDLTHDAGGSNTHWIALPFATGLASASDLGNVAPNITRVIRWDPATQAEQVWDVAGSTGVDFPLTPGEAYGVVISADTSLHLIGTLASASLILEHNAGDFNRHWLALPQPNIYPSASDLAAAFPAFTKIARHDPSANRYDAWFNLDGTWMGQDFPLAPGVGVVVAIDAETQFAPVTGYPDTNATSTPSRGYAAVTVNLSGTVDASRPIASYQWDFDGDGIFDYSSSGTPATQHTYASQGTYRPTLLVTDTVGHRTVAYAHLTVDTLDVDFSLSGFVPVDGESVDIGYTLSQDGTVTVLIYDAGGQVVRTLVQDGAQTAGAQSLPWDGLDDASQLALDGPYYVVIQVTAGGGTSVFDTRASSGGVDISGNLSGVSVGTLLSPLEGQYVDISYSLPENALVSIAIKDSSGNLIRQLLTDAPRGSGARTETWDGAQDNGQIVAPGTSFFAEISAESLASNSLVAVGLAPRITNVTAAPQRFSPATNPYGAQDNRSVVINYDLNKDADVTANVYGSGGTQVHTLSHPGLPAGNHDISWNGRNGSGVLMANGHYVIQLQATDAAGTASLPFSVQAEIFY